MQFIDNTIVEEIIEQNLIQSSIGAHFKFLWIQSDDKQRQLLQVIEYLGKADMRSIMRHSSQDESTIKYSLETLLRRDLLSCDADGYQVAVPMFRRWLKRYIFH